MEINRGNFEEALPVLEKACAKAVFIAIDLEFTGLGSREDNFTLFDSNQQRYEKLTHTVKSFIPCQIGIACFARNMQTNTFTVEPFNIYLFPSEFCSDRVFSCSSSALSFLSRNGFSFDKFVRDSVHFMNSDEIETVKNDLQAGLVLKNDVNETLLNDLSRLLDLWKDNTEQSLSIPLDEHGMRRMIFVYELSRRHPMFCIEDDPDDQTKIKVVRKSGVLDVDDEWIKSQEKIFATVTCGFRIFECISKRKIPLIGHNLEYDLMFLYQNLYRNLPESIYGFKDSVHHCFPIIYDTKIVANSLKQELEAAGLKRFRLEELYEAFQNPKVLKKFASSMPTVNFEDANCRYESDNSNLYHEAGYDAYMTGRVFITLMHISALKIRPRKERDSILPMGKYLKSMKQVCNRVYVGRGGMPYLNLTGPDPNRGKNNNIVKLNADANLQEVNAQLNGFRPYDVKKTKNKTFLATNTPEKAEEAIRKLGESGMKGELCPQDLEQRNKNIILGVSLGVLVLSVVLSWGLTFLPHKF